MFWSVHAAGAVGAVPVTMELNPVVVLAHAASTIAYGLPLPRVAEQVEFGGLCAKGPDNHAVAVNMSALGEHTMCVCARVSCFVVFTMVAFRAVRAGCSSHSRPPFCDVLWLSKS